MPKIDYLEKAKQYAISRGGECLATEYVSMKTKTHWKCGNPNHPAFETDFQIINRENWCVLCHREEVAKKYTLTNGLEKCHEHAKKHGGLCLSTEYKNAKTKMKWQCHNNHTWESSYDHAVNRNRWCQQCHYDKAIIKDGYDKIVSLAKTKGGSVKVNLNDEIKLHTQLEFKCSNPEHKSWFAEYRNIMNGTWCPYCAGKFSQDEYLELAKKHAISKGGQCLSTRYENQNTKLEWKCHDHSHKSWFSCYDKMIEYNSWCKQCNHIKKQPHRDKYLELAKKHAISKGGQCLSNEYINSTSKLTWKCSDQSHPTWEGTYGNIVLSNKWCPRCVGHFTPEEWLEKVAQHAKNRGGKFLSNKFTNMNTNYLWQCNNLQHKPWKASASNILNNNTWCPECSASTYYKENNTRVILEYLLNFELKKSRPKWNINPQTNNCLELDGYNEEHKFAFEFQGRHHFEENVFKNSNLQDIQYKDKIKKENCIINNTFLFIINDNQKIVLLEDWIDYIIKLLNYNNVQYNKNYNLDFILNLIIDKNKTNEKDMYLDNCKKYALSKNGECLSTYYTNYDTHLEWKCHNPEHKSWYGGIGIIAAGTWCPRCVGKFSKEEMLEKAKEYAISKGGLCLSTQYKNQNTKLEWKCSNPEHSSWFRNNKIFKTKTWCPECLKVSREIK